MKTLAICFLVLCAAMTARLLAQATDCDDPGVSPEANASPQQQWENMLAILAKDNVIGQQTLVPTYKSSATLVNLPTAVHSQSGEPVKGLTRRQFRLADNGVEQSLLVEEATNVPLSLIVMMQVGGNAPTFFRDYSALDAMLQTTFGNAIRQIALVTFDSRPEQIWNFPLRTDFLYFGLTHPDPGDQGAAILDALDCGVDLFRQTPPSFRPVILLLSQGEDQGSHANLQDVLKRAVANGVVVYSLTFREKKMHAKGSAKEHQNTVEAFARMSGGENFSFTGSNQLAEAITASKTAAENFYLLSFQPTSQEPGFHSITADVINQRESLRVLTRTGYWQPDANGR